MSSYAEIYDQVWQDLRYDEYSPEFAILPHLITWLEHHDAHSVLIVGCGSGRGLEALLRRGFDAYGLDCSAEAERLFRRRLELTDYQVPAPTRGHPARFRVLDVLKWDARVLEQYDACICVDVLEHIAEWHVHQFIRRIAEVRAERYLFTAANIPDAFGPLITGKSLHFTVKPADWWEGALSPLFIVERWRIPGERDWAANFDCIRRRL